MGRIKTLIQQVCLLFLMAGPLYAMADGPRDRTQVFAMCIGRFSAEMEHGWLMGDDGAPAKSRRALFEMLLETVATRSGLSGPAILDMRIRAKMAQARLLQIASFHTDPSHRVRAAAAARRAIRPCEALIIA
jgi:hypothetical protein